MCRDTFGKIQVSLLILIPEIRSRKNSFNIAKATWNKLTY